MSGSKNVVFKTENCVEKYNFTWEVSNFTVHPNGLRSAEFSPSDIIPLTLAVQIEFSQLSGYSSCSFILCKCSENEIPKTSVLRCITSIDNSQGDQLQAKQVKNFYSLLKQNEFQILYVQSVKGNLYSPTCFYDLTDGKIIVKCNITLYGHCVTSTSTANATILHDPTMNWKNLSGDFTAIYESKLLSDFTINITGREIRAHKLILSARSPVFKKMMENNWEECTSESITIGDVDFETFDCFLRYLYSGCMDDASFDKAWKLYALAYKYAVTGLQKESGRILGCNLSVERVCGVLELAYLNSDDDLKETAIEFLAHQFSEVRVKPKWTEILKKYPELASEVLGSVASILGGPKTDIINST